MTINEPELNAAVNEVLTNQLNDGNPPETKQTLDRLIASGHSEESARQMIAEVLLLEIRAVMASGKPYDNDRYTGALAELS
ncbi:hypothetical protein LOC71_08270 [Rhodopirellula sp. JC740]|uniref:Uncharacterized protein n=1 Tax=Rhodopirellula halodulae TaxID=2894198 RepID=A0ABS8NFE7_9BACT|nr:hypothetical protein [Rhodopirellula sp. JC740]MCC9642267.1 hypothetical protein [Rhodopirellula sp. JC740]